MKLKSIICGLLAIGAFIGCKEEIPLEPKLSLNRTSAEIGADQTSVNIEVTSNIAWSAEADQDWVTGITPNSSEASADPVAVTITVEPNTDEQARSATVTFTAGSVSKTAQITQAGKSKEDTPGEDVTGTDSDLFVAWAFSTDVKSLNESTWHQSTLIDKEEGFSDSYLNSTLGTGCIKYYQLAKPDFSTNKIYRHTGKKGEPLAYGSWVGDYFLFEATYNISADSNVGISFGIWGSAAAMKYWLLEYKDGEEWKSAAKEETFGDITYNVACGTEEIPTLVNESVVIRNASDKVQFRLRCVATISVSDEERTSPANNTYERINPLTPVIIKGSAITEDDIASIIAPAMSVDNTTINAGTAGVTTTLALTSNIGWTAEADVPWINILPPSGQASETATDVSVVIDENETTAPRSATITFTGTYGNVSLARKVSVAQTGKEPEPVDGTDSDLLVAWTFSKDLVETHRSTFGQNETNDFTPGDGGKYISPAIGTGKFSYVQVDKATLGGTKVYRNINDSCIPMLHGVWPEDYMLFEAETSAPLAANSNVGIAFYAHGGNTHTLKYWMLEYLDGEQWKAALTTTIQNDVTHNVALGGGASNTLLIRAAVVLANSTSKVSFRMRCVSNLGIDGTTYTTPPEAAIRINHNYPMIIKGSEITDDDIAAIIRPAISLDKTPADAAAEGGEVALAITSNMNWTATSDSDWASLATSVGTASETASSTTVTIAENTSAESRTATITVTGTYGNHTISKTVEINQAGKTESGSDDTTEPEKSKLDVQWVWNANSSSDDGVTEAELALKAANEGTFEQTENDFTTANNTTKYIASTQGNGKIYFYNADDKENTAGTLTDAVSKREIGKNAEALIYGAWTGDYLLFEASDGTEYPAGTKVSFSFGIYGSKKAVRDWSLEYYSSTGWTKLKDIQFTTTSASYSETVTLSSATSSFKFRLVCTGTTGINGNTLAAPTTHQRLAPNVPVVIQVVE